MNNESFHHLAPKWYINKTLVKSIKVRVNWLKNNVLAVLTLLLSQPQSGVLTAISGVLFVESTGVSEEFPE